MLGEMAARWDALVWDFNGTIVDDVDLALRSINGMLVRRGLAAVSRPLYRSVFGFPLLDYYGRLGIDIGRETPEGLSEEFHAAYLPGLSHCRLQKGVRSILNLAAQLRIAQYVLSALEEGLLREALGRLGIAGSFAGIYGLHHRLGDSKLDRGREMVTRHRLCGARTLLVGDMDHDAEVAAALGMSVALVARGHQDGERLRAVTARVFEDAAALRREIGGRP